MEWFDQIKDVVGFRALHSMSSNLKVFAQANQRNNYTANGFSFSIFSPLLYLSSFFSSFLCILRLPPKLLRLHFFSFQRPIVLSTSWSGILFISFFVGISSFLFFYYFRIIFCFYWFSFRSILGFFWIFFHSHASFFSNFLCTVIMEYKLHFDSFWTNFFFYWIWYEFSLPW